jgi:Domain of unknown function (DUF4386)
VENKDKQMQSTLQGRDGQSFYRKTAIAIGAIYLAGIPLGIGGNILLQSILGATDPLASVAANSGLVAIGALLWVLSGPVADAAHGILMFPIMKRYGERLAYGYFGARIMDAVFLGVMAILILFQLPLASEYVKAGAADTSYLQGLSSVFWQAQLYAYHFGMLTVGVAGVMLNYVLYRAQLLPRGLSVWGLVGYAVILVGSVFEVMGFNLMLIHSLPGGLWEILIGGVWLIAKGFSSSPSHSGETMPGFVRSPAVRSATA